LVSLARFLPSQRIALYALATVAGFIAVVVLLSHIWIQNHEASIVVPVAAPLSGPQADEGHAVVDAIQLYFDQVNQAGGVGGRSLRAQPIDDELDPAVARQRAQQIVNSDALAVIGHLNSVTSLAAAPVYLNGHLPAITASATVDSLTDGNPYYFRAIFDNSGEGIALAAYAHSILGFDRATIVYSDEPYGQSLSNSFVTNFEQAGGADVNSLEYDVEPDRTVASVQRIVSTLAADPNPGIVVLAMTGDSMTRDVMVAIRRAGLQPKFLGADAVGGDTFPQRFASIPEEQRNPGTFLDGMYAASPLIFDSSNSVAQVFVEAYRATYNRDPGWREAKYYDAAQILVTALRKASPQLGSENRSADRERVRAALASLNSPKSAVDSTTGPIYFDSNNSLSQPVRIGEYLHNRFVSAPVQLEVVTGNDEASVPDALATGEVVPLGYRYAWKQRVVYTGIDVNQVTDISDSKGTFSADIYLWFRYAGDDSVLDVEILNAAGTNFDPKAPLAADEVEGLHHRLYRVRGDFKSPFNLRDYPFDRQNLTIQLQNLRLSRNQVIYVVDAGSREFEDVRNSGANPVGDLPSWTLKDLRQYEDTERTMSTRGYPEAAGLSALSEYSTRDVSVSVQRRAAVFLLKTLLPLGLLAAVVFATLFLSVHRSDEARTIEVTSLVAAAVLLVAINQSISAGYIVAVEYAFFVFFALCLFCMIVHLVRERLRETRHAQRAERVVVWSRVFYVLVVIALIAIYAARYASRFN
jgi:branched-chain amino acid transport system substrate-binding protein